MDVAGTQSMWLVFCGWFSMDVAGASWTLVLCGCGWGSVDVAVVVWMWLVICGFGWCSVDVAGAL